MQTVNIICVGKLKEQYFRDACSEYIKRLNVFCKLNITEIREFKLPDNPNQTEIKNALKSEGEDILRLLSHDSFTTALCIKGSKVSSEGLASVISEKASNGISRLNFIIGSSHGLSDEVQQRANFKLSFSDMTFPHQLMRVILLEQVYRAYTIIANRDYHK